MAEGGEVGESGLRIANDKTMHNSTHVTQNTTCQLRIWRNAVAVTCQSRDVFVTRTRVTHTYEHLRYNSYRCNRSLCNHCYNNNNNNIVHTHYITRRISLRAWGVITWRRVWIRQCIRTQCRHRTTLKNITDWRPWLQTVYNTLERPALHYSTPSTNVTRCSRGRHNYMKNEFYVGKTIAWWTTCRSSWCGVYACSA